MGREATIAPDLSPSLSALLEQIFGRDFLVSHNRLAKGLKKKPLRLKALGDSGDLPYRLDGDRRVYAREDVAVYLAPRSPCQSIAPETKPENSKARTGSTTSRSRSRCSPQERRTNVVRTFPFSDRWSRNSPGILPDRLGACSGLVPHIYIGGSTPSQFHAV